ncbi:MAG: phasin family protein [Hyphomicrobiales bacterium]|jgi:polyhydroxyalkanoate synthesis regulator phasin
MIDQFKKALSTGVDLALKTWAEVEAMGKDMINKAQLPEKEAKDFLKGLRKTYENTQRKVEDRLSQLVKDVLKKADIPSSDELKALKREVQSLKKELKAAKTSRAGKAKPSKAKTQSAAKAKPRPKS